MISQLEDVLKFLESVPSPTGDSALQFVLTVWCQWQPYFYGAYETKVRYSDSYVEGQVLSGLFSPCSLSCLSVCQFVLFTS